MPVILLFSLPVVAVMLFAWGATYTANTQATAHSNIWRQLITAPIVAVQSLIHLFTKAAINLFGLIATNVDAQAGAFFHAIALTINAVTDTIVGASAFALQTATSIVQGVTHVNLGHLLRTIEHKITAATHTAETALNREIAHADAFARSIAHGVYPRLRSLEHDVTKVIPKEIKVARHLAHEAEKEALKAWKLAKKLERSLGVTAIATTIAAAIGLEAWNLIRCSSFGRFWGNRGCGVWDGLESLLGMLVDLFVIADLCDVIGPLEEAFSFVAAPAIAELTGAIDQMRCVAGNQPPTMAVPHLALPPNPGVSLSLP